MFDESWRRHRGPILLAFAGSVLLGSLLVAFILFVAGMSHCSECDQTPFLLRSFGLTLVIAATFGLAVGFGAAGLRWMLVDYLGRRATNASLVLVTLALVALAAPGGVAAIEYLEYRVDKAQRDAIYAAAMDLCPDRSRHLSIIHDALPNPLPRDTFVAEVRFADTRVERLHMRGSRADVIRIIQGDPGIRSLTVEHLLSDRCDEAFENGREGLVVVIPKEPPRYGVMKVEAIYARRGDGYRLRDGFQIQNWQRPYWLVQRPVSKDIAPGRIVETHAENGIAVTSVSSAPVVVPAAPQSTTIDALGPPPQSERDRR